MKQTVEETARTHWSESTYNKDAELAYDEKDSIAIKALAKSVALRAFKKGADWQAKQSPWISVEERLPENEDRVLVLCKMKRFNSYFTLLNNYIDGEWETKTLAYYDTIAWMPIPSFDEILEVNKDVLERIKEKED